MSTPPTDWPINGYWIKFDPHTHQGSVSLQLDNDPNPEMTIENLSGDDIAAIAALLSHDGARYYRSGFIGIRG
jgi:hypothetical protein